MKLKVFIFTATLLFFAFLFRSIFSQKEFAEPYKSSETVSNLKPALRHKSQTESDQEPKLKVDFKEGQDPGEEVSLPPKKSSGESRFRSELSRLGFSESEIEISIQYFNSEVGTGKEALVEIPRELSLDPEKTKVLTEAYWKSVLYGDGYNSEKIRSCLLNRFPKRSVCSDHMLREFLDELDVEMANGEFELKKEVVDIQKKYVSRSINECKVSEKYAEYQFSYVFVECKSME